MKSILLHVYEDEAFDGRLSVALDLCRACARRRRETLLGGVTRRLTTQSNFPILLGR